MAEAVKHTPGPWFVSRKYEVGPRSKADDQSNGMIVPLADVYGDNRNQDARLIAAAPDFLAASEALLVAWQKLVEALPQDDRIEAIEFDEFMDLRSAVAKARGIASWEVDKHLSKETS